MNLTADKPETTEPVQTLTVHHRCDTCGAQAYVQAMFTGGDLLFCGHHFTKMRVEIEKQAFRIVDETSFILPNRGPSTTAFS